MALAEERKGRVEEITLCWEKNLCACENERLTKRQSKVCKRVDILKIFSTREFHGLAVDDEVRQFLGNLSTLLLVLRKVKLLAQLHVKHLHVQVDTRHGNNSFT